MTYLEFPDPDFFPDVSNLLGNLNMGENLDAAGAAAAATAAAAAPAAPYVFLSFLYEIMVELFAIRTSLDWICSSIFLVRMASLICAIYVMFYLLYFWIKSYDNLLIFSIIQKPDYRQMNSSGIADATKPPQFDGSNYKR